MESYDVASTVHETLDGGDIVPVMAIMDTMKHIKSDVGTVAFGSARGVGGALDSSDHDTKPRGALEAIAECEREGSNRCRDRRVR
jgi:hypothetical protein